MPLKESIKLHSTYFDKYREIKLKPENTFINNFVDVLLEDIKPPLTIEYINAYLKDKLLTFASEIKPEKCALIVDACKKRSTLFSIFIEKMMDLQIHINIKEEEIISQVLRIPYQFILFNVDTYIYNLKFIYEYIRANDSKNKDTPLYLITSNKSHFEKIKNATFDDNTEILEPFNPKRVELVLEKFELLYVKKRLFNGRCNNAYESGRVSS
jgi:hypothetical protein